MKEILLLLIMFWNVENYFDPFDDKTVNDNEFTPRGGKFWNWKKFIKKRDDLAKVIMLVKEENGLFPAIIGVCEIENRFVLNQLLLHTPLAGLGYKIIHKDSPDSRGIDVAMLYNPHLFKILKTKFFPLKYNKDSVMASRFILYAKGVVNGLDTLHCFVNHWPSKLGGARRSLPRRMLASNILKAKTDSILGENSSANIVLMGDFNDTPNSPPLTNLDKFVNMTKGLVRGNAPPGTHKYKEKWEQIDQFLVSSNLSSQGNLKWIYCRKESMEIFTHAFLLQRDDGYLGEKLRKTLSGPKYLGGVSDHLPVILKIYGKDY
ncbi:MAG: endonuclease [Bacteroidales bacterium]